MEMNKISSWFHDIHSNKLVFVFILWYMIIMDKTNIEEVLIRLPNDEY
jgi:hypothetical protein